VGAIRAVFGVLFLEAVLLSLVIPCLAGLRGRPLAAIFGGLVVLGFSVTLAVGGRAVPLGALLGAQALLLAFGVLLLGLARAFSSRRSPGRSVLASLLGLALVASPFLTDPFLEDRDGRVRAEVRDPAMFLNPLAGVASPVLLGFDWLRQPIAYRTVTLGQFHAYRYPDPRLQAAAFFLAGVLLLLLRRAQIE